MRLLAALSGAVSVYLLVGLLTGHAPRGISGRRARSDGRDSRLRQAGLSVSNSQFMGASVAGAAFAFVAVWALSGAWTVGLVPALGVASLPRAWVAREATRIAQERVAAWPDTLRDLVAHLEAPMSLHRGLVELGRTGPAPLRSAWQRYERLTAALDHRTALEAIQAELADPVSDRVITVLLVAHEQGSGVVLDVLRDLADATAKDVRLHDEIETAQLERRIEARAAVVLPFAVLVLLCSSSPPYRDFYASGPGLVVIGVGAAMAVGGMAVIGRLGRLPTERRVLTGHEGAEIR